MQLSIIIVNYNVKYFLEHCLLSVQHACKNIEAEIIVVDNQSTDGSVEMMQQRFPEVILIDNQHNVGFAKANNQGVAISKGEYILYLNPDTIVPEDCFEKCISYMEQNQKVGALGCKMIDGQGQFLPESKRGFPSTKVAFFKISGISSIFKKSKIFNGYHLGHLSENDTNKVDVLAGCFMFCRREAIVKVGSFDEDYFMYGEDIDLSYKIKKAGFQNVYFADTTIIHYKGESTKKGSLNYVKMFYQAMIIFAKKHFTSSKKNTYVFFIQIAIYIRAILALISNTLSAIKIPLIDAGILTFSLFVMKYVWIKNIKVDTHYSTTLLVAFFSVYVLIWILSLYFNGAYDKPYKPMRVIRGMFIGAMFTLAFYGLLNEEIRFSRGITVLGALLGLLSILGIRKLMQWMKISSVAADTMNNNVLIVGLEDEENEIKKLLKIAGVDKQIIGSISPVESKTAHQLGLLKDIKPLSILYEIKEIIFAQKHLSFKQIIESMQACASQFDYKIHSVGSDSIIGSNSKNTAGDLYTTEQLFLINTPSAIRNKRLVDAIAALILFIFSPFLFWSVQNKSSFYQKIFYTLFGQYTFVGYAPQERLPKLKHSLLGVEPIIEDYDIPQDNKEHLEWLYAKDYDARKDVKIIFQKWKTV